MAAHAADLDGDGDLDIVACALLAGGSDVDEKTLPALVWLEQTSRGVFKRHTIEMGTPRHATLDIGDIDGDGGARYRRRQFLDRKAGHGLGRGLDEPGKEEVVYLRYCLGAGAWLEFAPCLSAGSLPRSWRLAPSSLPLSGWPPARGPRVEY